ncbi:hypothetical protein BH09MYX1_BH09MYX1_10650 [soil metagenome]
MNRSIALASAVVLSSVLGCGTASPPASNTPATPAAGAMSRAPTAEHVDGSCAKALVTGGAVLFDVRSKEEFDAGHIAGAVNVPFDTVATHDFGGKDKALVVYCGSGGRSSRAESTLVEKGYTKVNDLGAMTNWDK